MNAHKKEKKKKQEKEEYKKIITPCFENHPMRIEFDTIIYKSKPTTIFSHVAV